MQPVVELVSHRVLRYLVIFGDIAVFAIAVFRTPPPPPLPNVPLVVTESLVDYVLVNTGTLDRAVWVRDSLCHVVGKPLLSHSVSLHQRVEMGSSWDNLTE